MKTIKKILPLLLALMMLLSLLPASALAGENVADAAEPQAVSEEDAPVVSEEEEEAVIPEGSREAQDDIAAVGQVSILSDDKLETLAENTAVTPVRVVFSCEPAEVEVTVYDPAQLDANGEACEVKAEQRNTWLLAPGAYLYDAACEGYEPVVKAELIVSAPENAEQSTVWLTLTAIDEEVAPQELELLTLTPDSIASLENPALQNNAGPSVLGVWYYNTLEGQTSEIHVTTSLDAQYLYLYMGDTLLTSWSAAEANIDANASNKEWHVGYVFAYPGAYYLSYKVSADGETQSDSFAFDPINVGRPPVLDWWYDKGFENTPVALHVYTNLDMEHLYIYLGDDEVAAWSLADEGIQVIDAPLYREWVGTLTFEYPGTYNLWYKASADGVNLSNAYSDLEKPLIVGRPGVISYWYDNGVEQKPMPLHITTNLDAQYLYMYLGDELLQSWTEQDAEITVYEAQLCKEWTVSYTFEYPGSYNLWYKSSADGVEMSNAYSDAQKPAIVKRPQIIELAYGTAMAGEELTIDITTSQDVQTVYMYLGEELLARWNRGDEGLSIESFATCDVWHVRYVFDEAGEKYLWYKASDDGVNQGNAFPFDPVTILEAEVDDGYVIALTFPDEAFQAFVRSFDLNSDGMLSDREIALVTSMNCSSLGIQSLEGIAIFTALTELDCSDNELQTLDLSENTALTALLCKDNADLQEFELPDAMTTITDYAFQSCTSLVTIRLPAGVTQIGEYAFNNCTGLTSVELCDSVTRIGAAAFKGCTSLSSMSTYQCA